MLTPISPTRSNTNTIKSAKSVTLSPEVNAPDHPFQFELLNEHVRRRCESKLFDPLPPHLIPSSLPRQSRAPDTGKQVLTLILILAIKLDILIGLFEGLARAATARCHASRLFERIREVVIGAGRLVLPAHAADDALGLEDELADLVLLRLLLGVDVLPAEDGAAHHAGDVADRVRARHQLPWHRLVRVRVRQVAG